MDLSPGDRVRITTRESEYTGCRGTIVDTPGAGEGVSTLGLLVRIDGETVPRPFLLPHLEALRGVKVRAGAPERLREREA